MVHGVRVNETKPRGFAKRLTILARQAGDIGGLGLINVEGRHCHKPLQAVCKLACSESVQSHEIKRGRRGEGGGGGGVRLPLQSCSM